MSTGAPIWVVATQETVARWGPALRAAGLDVVPLAWAQLQAGPDVQAAVDVLSKTKDAWVVVTSEAALRFLPDDAGAGCRIACVGPRTANIAVQCGFTVALMGTSDGAALAAQLIGGPGPKDAVVLRAILARPELLQALTQAQWAVRVLHTYSLAPEPSFAATITASRAPAAVVVGSPRAAHALLEAAASSKQAPVVAIGDTTARTLRDLGCTRVAVADHPTTSALVAAVQRVVRGES